MTVQMSAASRRPCCGHGSCFNEAEYRVTVGGPLGVVYRCSAHLPAGTVLP